MTKQLSPSERRHLTVSLGDFFHEFSIKPDVRAKSTEPYAKRDEGRKRREERRQVRNFKHAHLN